MPPLEFASMGRAANVPPSTKDLDRPRRLHHHRAMRAPQLPADVDERSHRDQLDRYRNNDHQRPADHLQQTGADVTAHRTP
jgi:hypothetical protein